MEMPTFARLDSLSFYIPSSAEPSKEVRVMVTHIERKHMLTVVETAELTAMANMLNSSISTYSMTPERFESHPAGKYTQIADNKGLVNRLVIYVGVPPLMQYLTRKGELIKTLSPDFYHEHRYGEQSKSISHYYRSMIEKECSFDTMEEALAMVEKLASDNHAMQLASAK